MAEEQVPPQAAQQPPEPLRDLYAQELARGMVRCNLDPVICLGQHPAALQEYQADLMELMGRILVEQVIETPPKNQVEVRNAECFLRQAREIYAGLYGFDSMKAAKVLPPLARLRFIEGRVAEARALLDEFSRVERFLAGTWRAATQEAAQMPVQPKPPAPLKSESTDDLKN